MTAVLAMFGRGDKAADEKAAAEAAPAGDQSLTLWLYDSRRIEVPTELGKKFEAEYGVSVEVAMVDLSEIRNQLLVATGGGEAADLAIIPHDNLGGFVSNDAVLEADPGGKESKYLAPALDAFNYNGKLYDVPLAVENIGFFVNKNLTDKVPATWEEMYAEGKALVDAGEAEYIMGYPDAAYNVFSAYSSYGGYIFGRDSSGALTAEDIGMNNDGLVKGLEPLTTMVMEGYVPEKIDWDGAHVLFESGQAPYVCTGPLFLNRFKEAGVDYEIASFPSGGKPFLGVQGIIISAASPSALAAQTFATEFIATEENMQAIFDAERRPSAWKTIFENSGNEDAAGFNEAGVEAIPTPSIPEMGFVRDAWLNAAAPAFSGELTPEEALDNCVAQVQTQIDETE